MGINEVITLINAILRWVTGVISPRTKWSDMGPYLQLVFRAHLVEMFSKEAFERSFIGVTLVLLYIYIYRSNPIQETTQNLISVFQHG